MYATPFKKRKQLSVWRGKNATIFPLREVPGDNALFGRGGVVDENGDYVPLSGIEKRIMDRYPFENPLYRDEQVVYCGYLVNHWGHFLVEAVTRLWYALEADDTIDKYVFFVNEGEERVVKGNYRKFFELLKIWDKLELVNVPTTYREVVVPEISFQNMTFYSPRYLAIFDALAENVTVNSAWHPAEKVYLTRSQFASQNGYEFGLEALDNFFTRNGYTVIAPEKLPLDQLIYLLRQAREVATISGSTAHNVLFGKSGQQVTIMERLIINDDHQVGINQMRALQVTPVDANFHLYPVGTCGPYILGFNHLLSRYAADRGLLPPDEKFTSKAYLDHCFKQYMFSYFDNYRHEWYMESWYPEICDSLYEAYEDSYPCFREYLEDEKPFLRQHYFQPHYWKQFVKRMIRKA